QRLLLGFLAEPFLVSPNHREAEGLVGHDFSDDDDFMLGLDAIAERGARNVLITHEAGCFALLREEREVHRYRVQASQVEPVSIVGSGDVLLAAFLAAWLDDKPANESLRPAVATGAVVRGVDVSHWKGRIDWPGVRGGGYRFAFTEATNGFGVDWTYGRNRSGSKAVGLAFGGYHMAQPKGSTPQAVLADAVA